MAAGERFSGLRGPAHSGSSRSSHDNTVWRKEAKFGSGLDHRPAALMHQPMVVVAEQDLVGDVVWSPSRPGDDVMRVRPVDRPVATMEAQPRSRTRSALRLGAELTRVARPTSMT